jgi:Tfp pilus assembly PilM family ATPase
MARTFPPDVIVLDSDSLLHVRLARGKSGTRVQQAKSYRLAAGTFTNGVVSPDLADEGALAETLRRLRMETGRWDKVSLLLPDSWFRINLVDLPSLPDRAADAAEVVRWSLKRTLPIAPEELRVAYEVLSRAVGAVKVLVVSALEKTLATIERVFADAGFDVILVEPVGLNIWNAVAVREPPTQGDRLFVFVRDTDFTTAVFRGALPLFIRSRNLNPERTLQQEIRLSASYLRDTLQATGYETLYVAGNQIDPAVSEELASAFNAPVRAVTLRDYIEDVPTGAAAYEAELTACTGVFTG